MRPLTAAPSRPVRKDVARNRALLLQLEALFADRINRVVQIVQEADALDDPLQALHSLLSRIGELQAADRGLRAAFGANHEVDTAAQVREQLEPPSRRIVQRARR